MIERQKYLDKLISKKQNGLVKVIVIRLNSASIFAVWLAYHKLIQCTQS